MQIAAGAASWERPSRRSATPHRGLCRCGRVSSWTDGAAAIVAVMIGLRPQSFRIMLMPFMIKLGPRAARNPGGRARAIPSASSTHSRSCSVPGRLYRRSPSTVVWLISPTSRVSFDGSSVLIQAPGADSSGAPTQMRAPRERRASPQDT